MAPYFKRKLDTKSQHRRSLRLKNYNYFQPGAHFITICTYNRVCTFGGIVNGEMILNGYGNIAQQCWLEIPKHFPDVEFDEFVIIPNHIHGIIFNTDKNVQTYNDTLVGTKNFSTLHDSHQIKFRSPSQTIGSIVCGFKIGVTKWFRQNTNIYTVWQRNCYEHIIRNETELNKVCEYLINNPLKWELDIENPEKKKEYKSTKYYFKEMLQ